MTIILDPPVSTPSPGPGGDLFVPGIEARHTWQPADGDPFSLGGVDFVARNLWPNYRMQKIEGRHDKADLEDKRDPATARLGEIARRTLKRGKTEAWTGTVRARSLPELRAGVSALAAAFTGDDEGEMTIHAPASYPGLPDFTYRARCTAFSAPDEQTRGPDAQETGGWERDFVLTLRLSDPRYFSAIERQATAPAPSFSPSGWQLPVALPAPISGDQVTLTNLLVVNGGTAPAEPILELRGPVVDPWFVNLDVGAAIYFERGSLSVGGSQTLTLDFQARTITLDGQPVSRDRIDWSISNWWDAGMPGLATGEQAIRYGGSTQIGAPASLTVRWHDAVWS